MQRGDRDINSQIEFVAFDEIGIFNIVAHDNGLVLLRDDFVNGVRDENSLALRRCLWLHYIKPSFILLIILDQQRRFRRENKRLWDEVEIFQSYSNVLSQQYKELDLP